MLNLTNLRSLLSQAVSPADIHTAALFTPEGQLISFAADPARPKDEIRILVGVGGEVWQETREQGTGMLESEVGRLLVMPVQAEKTDDDDDPVLILALNAADTTSWRTMQNKAKQLMVHLGVPVSSLRAKLATAPSSPIAMTQRTTTR